MVPLPIIAMVAVGVWFIVNYLAPGSPSWVVYIFGGAAMLAACGMAYKKGTKGVTPLWSPFREMAHSKQS